MTDDVRTARGGSGVPRSPARPARPSVPAAAEREPPSLPAPAAPRPQPRDTAAVFDATGAVNVKLIYAAFLLALALPPAALVGALFAHLARRRGPPAWLLSHHTYLIRTFWIGLVASGLAFALSFVGVGLLLEPLIAVWLVARAVHGLARASRGEAVEHPEGYFV